MVADKSEQPVQHDVIEELLETFMHASTADSLLMLEKQGHILLSDPALQQVRDQITELSEIIETLKGKLHLLEETKQRFTATQRMYPGPVSSYPLKVENLLQALSNMPDRSIVVPDRTEIADIMANIPPEMFVLFIQQLSSPQQQTVLMELLQKFILSEQQRKSIGEGLSQCGPFIKRIDRDFLDFFLQQVWKLPIEQRKRVWLGETHLLDLANMQSYIEHHQIDLSALNEQAQQVAHLSTTPDQISAEEGAPEQKDEWDLERWQRDFGEEGASMPILPLVTEESSSQIVDRETLLSTLRSELQRAIQDAGNAPFSISPDLFDRMDNPSAPIPKSIRSLYRALFLLQRSEGRRLPEITAVKAILNELLSDSSPVPELDPHMRVLIEQFQSFMQFAGVGEGEKSEQEIQEKIEALTAFLATYPLEDQPVRVIALLTRCMAYLERTNGNKREDFERAIQDCDALIELGAANQQAMFEAYGYMARGVVRSIYTQTGNRQEEINQALADFEKALLFFTSETYPNEWAEIHFNRSVAYQRYNYGDLWQNYEHALKDSEAALSILSSAEKPMRWAAANKSCGDAYRMRLSRNPLSDIQKAREHYDEALKVFNPQNAPDEWASTQIARASIERRFLEVSIAGNQREARLTLFNLDIPFFLEAFSTLQEGLERIITDLTGVLSVATKESDPYNWADAHYERAFTRAMQAQGERKKLLRIVLADFYSALEVFTPERHPERWAGTQLKIATVLLRFTVESFEQDAKAALLAIDAALKVYRADTMPFNYYRAQELRSLFCERLGLWAEAHLALLEARRVERRLIVTTQSGKHLHDLLAEFTRPEVCLRRAQVALRLDPPDYEEAARALEEGRAQSLQHEQASPDQAEVLPSSPPLKEIVRGLTHQRAALVYLAAGANLTTSVEADRHISVGFEGGLALILTREPDGMPRVEHLSLPHLTSMALTFLLEPVFEAGELKEQEQRARRSPSKPESGVSRHQKSDKYLIPIKLDHAIAKLGELGLNDLAQILHARGMREVTFVTYSSLSLFPLNAVQVRLANGETHYLGELFEVTFAPSAYAAARARQRAAIPQELATVFTAGNPQPQIKKFKKLPYAAGEAQLIHEMAKMLGYDSCYLRPEQITRERLLRALCRKKDDPIATMYAHLALHAIYQTVEPRHSQLVLAGTEDVPERARCIFLEELLNGEIDLSGVRLLILSACQSSVIDIQQIPNEVVGLAPAFLQAGATGVIASLWKVKDMATYLLMTCFAQLYLGSCGTISPARALAMAQHWLREEATYRVIANYNPLHLPLDDPQITRWGLEDLAVQAAETPDALPFSHPKYWAGFTLNGY